MSRLTPHKWATVTFISVCMALIIGVGLTYSIQKSVELLPIRKYFDQRHTNAVWDWSNVMNHSAKDLDEQSSFLYLHQINTVYVDVGAYESILLIKDASQRKEQIGKLEESLANYIKAMEKRGIRVFASAGNTEWSKPEYVKVPLAIQQFVYDFNDKNDLKFAGLEYDVESYNQKHFEDASMTEKSLVLLEFLDMADMIATRHQKYIDSTKDKEIELGFAIPYWFDNENQNIKSVDWHDKTGPVLYHLLDRLNELPNSNVVVMAYRNAAAGNDGMIYHSRTEVEYAESNAPNVKILMGIEVNDVEPAKITFFGRTFTELSSQVMEVQSEYKNKRTYSGIAINDLPGYQSLDANSIVR